MTKVIVIGAGIYGLAAAKTYLQVEPDVDLTILDKENSVGGVWSKENIYRDLYAQLTYPNFEYYDFPMKPRPGDISTDRYISGTGINHYLHQYAENFGLTKRLRLGVQVDSITREPNGQWRVHTSLVQESTPEGVNFAASKQESLLCDKLMIAVGTNSKPSTPTFPRGVKAFVPPIIHSKDIGRSYSRLVDPKVKRVLVVGGAKSAYDAVFLALDNGKHVDWIIRPDGAGPVALFPDKYLFGRVKLGDVVNTRLIAKLASSYFNTTDWWYTILHKTWIGAKFTKLLWSLITKMNNAYALYQRQEFENLRPTPDSYFWCNAGLGAVSVPRFYEVMNSGSINIRRDRIAQLEESWVDLKSGERLQTDFIVCCTGWDDDISFFGPDTMTSLGLPQFARKTETVDVAFPEDLRAEETICTVFPLLRDRPQIPYRREPKRTWRLYNRIVPLSLANEGDNSVVFLGQLVLSSTMMVAGVQALWATAYLRGELALPAYEEMEKEVAEWNVWKSRRYLNMGNKTTFAMYESIPYIDRLLEDLGIEKRRKEGFFADNFLPYEPRDYINIVQEWKTSAQRKSV